MQFLAMSGVQRLRERAGDRLRPELQQRGAGGQAFALRLDGEPREFLAERLGGDKQNQPGGGIPGGQGKLVSFGHGEHAVEELRLHGEKLELERPQLAGAQDEPGVARRHETVAGLEFTGAAALLPVAHALRDARDGPAGRGRGPLAGRAQDEFLQNQMSLNGHWQRENADVILPEGFDCVTIVKHKYATRPKSVRPFSLCAAKSEKRQFTGS